MPWLKLCATPRKRRQHVALEEHAVFISDELLTQLREKNGSAADALGLFG
jgi:hypothetical protein